MLYERLEHDQLAVRERWSSMFPENELEKVALAFGISFGDSNTASESWKRLVETGEVALRPTAITRAPIADAI
jgi:hypothetical protein